MLCVDIRSLTVNIIIGCDHAGFDLKEACKAHLESNTEHDVTDIGAYSRDSVEYPRIAHELARSIEKGEFDSGILICGTGLGMSMVANRYKGVRAALCHNIYTARMSRLHNDANVLAMGGRVTVVGLALEMVDVFLATPFEGGRHQSRLNLFGQ
jgi:ribose 5-phosphate isomerase B